MTLSSEKPNREDPFPSLNGTNVGGRYPQNVNKEGIQAMINEIRSLDEGISKENAKMLSKMEIAMKDEAYGMLDIQDFFFIHEN